MSSSPAAMPSAAKVLAFASVVEAGTGIALMVVPDFVVRLLLGTELDASGIIAGRCFGVALLALSVACRPGRNPERASLSAVRGMLLYNALIAAYLAWLGAAGRMSGPLLWPAAVLHAVVALLLGKAAQRA